MMNDLIRRLLSNLRYYLASHGAGSAPSPYGRGWGEGVAVFCIITWPLGHFFIGPHPASPPGDSATLSQRRGGQKIMRIALLF